MPSPEASESPIDTSDSCGLEPARYFSNSRTRRPPRPQRAQRRPTSTAGPRWARTDEYGRVTPEMRQYALMAGEPRRVVVAGQGYVGLPLAMRAVEVGHSVVGYDTNEGRVKRLAAGESYVEDVSDD